MTKYDCTNGANERTFSFRLPLMLDHDAINAGLL
jgi:hypothetical protein